MPRLPVISGRELIKFLEYLGFFVTRKKGSHVRMKSEGEKYTTVAIHGQEAVPKGLLRKIIREDLEMSLEEFVDQFETYKKRN